MHIVKETGFQSSLKGKQTWPPKTINVREWSEVNKSIPIKYEETQSPAPLQDSTSTTGLQSTSTIPHDKE